jgi:hypothetical protein
MAGKRAVVWQDGDELIITIVATDAAVTRQRTEIEAAGLRFVTVGTVLNVDDSRARRTRGASS